MRNPVNPVMMKDATIITIIALTLIFAAFNAYQDKEEMHEHQGFFDEVRQFINRGDRNTAEQGYNLCLRLNKLEKSHNIVPSDCDFIYKRNQLFNKTVIY